MFFLTFVGLRSGGISARYCRKIAQKARDNSVKKGGGILVACQIFIAISKKHPQDDLLPWLNQACVHRFTPAPLEPPLGDSPSPSPPPLHQLHLPTHCIEIRATSCYFVQNTMVVHLGPRGNQKMKMFQVRFSTF